MSNLTVCILTAGKGTRMGKYSQYINKALLPIDKIAAISHIIKKFPANTEFVVAVGYLGEQVENYLQIAHEGQAIRFVNVDNFDGPGSGPGYSLLCCKEYLQKPFYFVSCDTLWNNELDFEMDNSWMGVATTNPAESAKYCNFEITENRIVALKDKVKVDGPEYKAFTGLCYIKEHEIFWDSLFSNKLIADEWQISNGICGLIEKTNLKAIDIDWVDLGNCDNYIKVLGQYENYDFSKSSEFLYIVNNRVIKFFVDENIVRKRVERSYLNKKAFPDIDIHKGQFYSYKFMEGKTLYQQNNCQIFKDLLEWLYENVWEKADVTPEKTQAVCKKFYYEKTNKRLDMYYEKYAFTDCSSVVNDKVIPPTSELLNKVPWEKLYDGRTSFIHGDLQFDNIIHNDDGFMLIDWREDFGGQVEFGDQYYDLAKLYGGIILNYDFIKSNLFSYEEKDGKIYFDFAQRLSKDVYLGILTKFVEEKGLDINKVRMLVAIIYLNMSPLHHNPFDKMLYSLGRTLLASEIEKL